MLCRRYSKAHRDARVGVGARQVVRAYEEVVCAIFPLHAALLHAVMIRSPMFHVALSAFSAAQVMFCIFGRRWLIGRQESARKDEKQAEYVRDGDDQAPAAERGCIYSASGSAVYKARDAVRQQNMGTTVLCYPYLRHALYVLAPELTRGVSARCCLDAWRACRCVRLPPLPAPAQECLRIYAYVCQIRCAVFQCLRGTVSSSFRYRFQLPRLPNCRYARNRRAAAMRRPFRFCRG